MRNIIAIGRIIIFKIDFQCIFSTVFAKDRFVDLRNGIYIVIIYLFDFSFCRF